MKEQYLVYTCIHFVKRPKHKEIIIKNNTILQHSVAPCRSYFMFHFCCLCATSVNVHPSSLYYKALRFGLIDHRNLYKLLCWRNLLLFSSIVIALGYFYVDISPLPCTCSVHGFVGWLIGSWMPSGVLHSNKSIKDSYTPNQRKSTNQQNHKLNTFMGITWYQHKNSETLHLMIVS
jgi:hypothetical protein